MRHTLLVSGLALLFAASACGDDDNAGNGSGGSRAAGGFVGAGGRTAGGTGGQSAGRGGNAGNAGGKANPNGGTNDGANGGRQTGDGGAVAEGGGGIGAAGNAGAGEVSGGAPSSGGTASGSGGVQTGGSVATAGGSFGGKSTSDAGAGGLGGVDGTGEAAPYDCGSPSFDALNAGETFGNASGQLEGAKLLLDFGASSSPIFMEGNRVLATSAEGGWRLWDTPSRHWIARGSGDLLALAGGVFVVRDANWASLEFRAIADAHVLGTVTGQENIGPLFGSASDGSYFFGVTDAGNVQTWKPDGTAGFALTGFYGSLPLERFLATPQALRVPSGVGFVSLDIATGQVSDNPPYLGEFCGWSRDGARFITKQSDQVIRIYAIDGTLQKTTLIPGFQCHGGIGTLFWDWTRIFDSADLGPDPNNPRPVATFQADDDFVTRNGLLLFKTGLGVANYLAKGTRPSLPVVSLADGIRNTSSFGAAAIDAQSRSAVLSDGLSFTGTTSDPDAHAELGCGSPNAVAASASGTIAVATANRDEILLFDVTSKKLVQHIPHVSSRQLAVAADASALVASRLEGGVPGALDVFSLPNGDSLATLSAVNDFGISRNGQRLSRSCSNQITDLTGANAVSLAAASTCTPPRLSPDGTRVAQATLDPHLDDVTTSYPALPQFDLYEHGNFVDLVSGYPLRWIDDQRLLVQQFERNKPDPQPCPSCPPPTYIPKWVYVGSSIVDASGHPLTSLSLPNMADFYVISSNEILSVTDGNTYDLSTGAVVRSSGLGLDCFHGLDGPVATSSCLPNFAFAGDYIVQIGGRGVYVTRR